MNKRFTREEMLKDLKKAEQKIKEIKELQMNMDALGAEKKIREATEFLEYMRAKYIPEKVTFT